MNRFETEKLSSMMNLKALMELSGTWFDLVQECVLLDKLILDWDSSQNETYGARQGSAYNGHFERRCYYPPATSVCSLPMKAMYPRVRGISIMWAPVCRRRASLAANTRGPSRRRIQTARGVVSRVRRRREGSDGEPIRLRGVTRRP